MYHIVCRYHFIHSTAAFFYKSKMHLSQITFKKYIIHVKMVHELLVPILYLYIQRKKMAAIPFLSLSFILSVVICILCLLFLACHVNILYSVFVDFS